MPSSVARMIKPPTLNMILGQLSTNRVLEQEILDAFATVPRERFVPPALAGAAYADEDLPLGKGRFLLAPLSFARMLQAADISTGEKVLLVGCNTGYSVAMAAKLAGDATGCDVEEEFIAAAKKNLSAIGSKGHVEKVSSLARGMPGDAYDVIIVEGAVETLPGALKDQLAEGGRLVTVERKARMPLAQGLSRLVQYNKMDGEVFCKETLEMAVPLLPGFEAPKGFVF